MFELTRKFVVRYVGLLESCQTLYNFLPTQILKALDISSKKSLPFSTSFPKKTQYLQSANVTSLAVFFKSILYIKNSMFANKGLLALHY